MSVLQHCHGGVNLHLAAGSQKDQKHHCTRNTEQTREGTGHGRTLPAPHQSGPGNTAGMTNPAIASLSQ
jgi:hypothetical protein